MPREYVKLPLSAEEKQMVESLIATAEGMGRLRERTLLSGAQSAAIENLAAKKYVTLTKKKFMVVLPP